MIWVSKTRHDDTRTCSRARRVAITLSRDVESEDVFLKVLTTPQSNCLVIIEYTHEDRDGDDGATVIVLLSVTSGHINQAGCFFGQRKCAGEIYFCGDANRNTYTHFWMDLTGCYGISKNGDVARLHVEEEVQQQVSLNLDNNPILQHLKQPLLLQQQAPRKRRRPGATEG